MPKIRLIAAALVAALALAGCSQDIRDVKLSEMNQPDNAQKLLEDLTVEERNTIAYYVGERSARGDIDFKVTIGEVLKQAAKEKAEAEERRIKAEAEAVAQRAEAEAARESFLKARAEADKKRLAELMAMQAADLRGLSRREQSETMSEFSRLVSAGVTQEDFQAASSLGQRLPLLSQYLWSEADLGALTLSQVWDQVQQDPEGARARMRDAADAAAKRRGADRYLQNASVRDFVRNPNVRSAVSALFPAEDLALLEGYIAAVHGQAEIAALHRKTLGEALQEARQSQQAL